MKHGLLTINLNEHLERNPNLTQTIYVHMKKHNVNKNLVNKIIKKHDKLLKSIYIKLFSLLF
jgi:hypothetical protein